MAVPVPVNNPDSNIANSSEIPNGLEAGGVQAAPTAQPVVQLAHSTAPAPQPVAQPSQQVSQQQVAPVQAAATQNQQPVLNIPKPQVPGTSLLPVQPQGGAVIPEKKKPKALNFNMILYAVIFVLLIIIIVLAGLSISLITNGGVNVSLEVPQTTTPTATDQNTTEETPTNEDMTIDDTTTEPDLVANTDVIVYLTFDIPEGGDSAPIRAKYVGTSDIDADTLLVPVIIKPSESDSSALSEALMALLDADAVVIDDELIIQFLNPLATSGLGIELEAKTVSGIVEDTTEVNIITADDLMSLPPEMVDVFKQQIEKTVGIYVDAFEILLNGDAEAYAAWGVGV